MSRRRYVWRVTATYPAGPVGGAWTNVRHYHSQAAARHRAAVLTGAVEPANPEWVNFGPRPESVTIERSAPVDGWEPVS